MTSGPARATAANAAFVDFAGNDYLGLARDPRLAEAAHRAAMRLGVSPTSSRWVLGWTDIHEQLEGELAEFLGSEATCLLGQAFLGGVTYFTTLADEFDTVYCDELSHTNLVLGMRAAGMRIETYRHLDVDDLRSKLESHAGKPPIIATDTLFSISGELAPLAAVRDLARRNHAELLLDDAHGVFALGSTGRGAAQVCSVAPAEATVLGTMSKALGAGGGFLSGRKELVERFRRSTPVCASTPLSIPIAAAALEGLRIVREDSSLLRRLNENARQMRSALETAQIEVATLHQTPIIAMQHADKAEAQRMSAHLLDHKLRVPYFAYPAEPRDNLLRAVARSCHTEDDLTRFADVVASFPR